MKTAFLGSYGFGNLGDELCLLQAIEAFPSTEVHAFTVDPEWTSRIVPVAGVFRTRAAMNAAEPERVVFGGGGVGFFPSIRDNMHWMMDAQKSGAKTYVHNIGVAMIEDMSWLTPQLAQVFERLDGFSVRDETSAGIVARWGLSRRPEITYYPEVDHRVDDSLAGLLGSGPVLGISITGQPAMRDAMNRSRKALNALIERFAGHTLAPIVSTVHVSNPDEDDMAGFEAFRRAFLPDNPVADPVLLDRGWWRETLTPANLKGLIARCDTLISQRKHNCVHAIGAGTRVVGLHPAEDDSVPRVFGALRSRYDDDSFLFPI